ncbi:MAG: protein translocase subunit SecD [Candidatus Wildermuthbacteria bacterium]|nr:protein translocase subunit SecD [Candidatus Wildermuthbacteria bacterium]
MSKKKTYIATLIIFVLTFFAGNLVYPQLLKLPYFSGKDFKLGLDLQGGTHLVYQSDLSGVADKDKGQAMAGLRDVIERRVNFFGVKEPLVQVEGEKLVVELAGVIDPGEAIKQIGQTPFLEFKEQKSDYQEILDSNKKITETEDSTSTLADPFQSASLTGKYLDRAEVNFDQTTYKPIISLQFSSDGAKIFEDITAKNVGKVLAIYIDGIPISAPVVQEKISGGKAQITGSFTIQEAQSLVSNLNAGALPVPIKLISQQSVGPTLGKVSLEQSLRAGIIGFLAVIIFMIIFYRLPGVLASLALAIYVLINLAFFKLIPVTLTLAGIAGFILSIGMAVDANVLIFSRIREELKIGGQKSLLASVEEGFRRAWPSIRDSNLNTLIVSSILFTFGTSFVKGFAFTVILGVLVSMFSAIFITQNFIRIIKGSILGKIKWLW